MVVFNVEYVYYPLIVSICTDSSVRCNRSPGQSAAIKFNPRLRVYVTSEYQESAVLRGPVSVRPILDVDVSQVGESTRLALTYDAASGTFSLNNVA